MFCAPREQPACRIHARRGFVDATNEGDRALEDWLQPFAILDARRGVLVLDDEMGVGDVERQQPACGELVIEPVHGAVL